MPLRASAVGTVPVINYPTILRDQPLVDGEHCIFYSPEPGRLAATIRTALADKGRLERMATAAKAHVAEHNTIVGAPGLKDSDLSVFDVAGRRVTTLAQGAFAPGRYSVHWDARAASGRTLGSGVYFLRLVGDHVPTQNVRVTLVR